MRKMTSPPCWTACTAMIALVTSLGLLGCDGREAENAVEPVEPEVTVPAPPPEPGQRVAPDAAAPSLVVTIADSADRLTVGRATTYTITVKNEGTTAAEDVVLLAELPENVRFEKAAGPTNAQFTGSELSFGPILRLAPGADATWTIAAIARRAGEGRIEAAVNSVGLREPIKEARTTRIVAAPQ